MEASEQAIGVDNKSLHSKHCHFPLRRLLLEKQLDNSLRHRQLDGQTEVLHEREVMQRGNTGDERGVKQEDKGQASGAQDKRRKEGSCL